MARRVFFSFHYDRDVWRAGQVRNSNLLQASDLYGFIDSAESQSLEVQGASAIKGWISGQMEYTSVTAILIGAETADRPWVLHEIAESWNRGNGILGIRIHNIKDQHSQTDTAGQNPLDRFKLSGGTILASVCKTYDWVLEDGRENLGKWVEEAFQIRAAYPDSEKIAEVGESCAGAQSVKVARTAPVSAGFAPRRPWCS